MLNAFPQISCCYFDGVAGQWPHTAAHDLPLVVRVDEFTTGHGEQLHCHNDFLALYIVRKGRGSHVIDGVPHAISRGDVYVMGIGSTHSYVNCVDLVSDALYFTPDIFDVATLEALSETPGFLTLFFGSNREDQVSESGGRWLHLTPDAYSSVSAQIAELRDEWLCGDLSGRLLTRPLFLRLLVHLARRHAENERPIGALEPAVPATNGAIVAAALQYFDEHFREPIRIEQVAQFLFLSPGRLTEIFAEAVGRTPRDYLRHLRLERAKNLLATTDTPVSEVGAQSGFEEPAYFARVFRLATGTTPSDWRRR